jgi:glyoxylase-like metal-dependent hydrolase (beta-lactamase superfamily II)
MDERLYFRQLLSGRDFAVDDPLAGQMVNHVYAIGDRSTREAMLVDPAYRVADLLDLLAEDGFRLTGVLVTHHHPDHVGGSMMGYDIEGLAQLLEKTSVPVHVHRDELTSVARVTGASSELVAHEGGEAIDVGAVTIQLMHTPGHTPGSQCFLVDRLLVSGDTLFLEGCGRTDLPGADPSAMYDSLARLATLPDDVVVFPGHRYSVASMGSLAAIKETNYVYKPKSREQWLTMFAGA